MSVAPILTQEELEKCENPYEEIEKMAKGLVEEIKDKEYERGMEDCWEMVKNLYLMFGSLNFDSILLTSSVKEAEKMVNNYIKNNDKKFHVGDEVIFEKDRSKCVIIRIVELIEESDEIVFNAMDNEGRYFYVSTKYHEIKKTGRHFNEVKELLEKLKED